MGELTSTLEMFCVYCSTFFAARGGRCWRSSLSPKISRALLTQSIHRRTTFVEHHNSSTLSSTTIHLLCRSPQSLWRSSLSPKISLCTHTINNPPKDDLCRAPQFIYSVEHHYSSTPSSTAIHLLCRSPQSIMPTGKLTNW